MPFLWLALLSVLLATPVGAASKSVLAALGDAAPGGGVFVGPSFLGTPSAAGSGWVAFRTELVQGPTTETIIVTNFITRERRAIAVGDTISPTIGTIRRFLGSPVVNARGHVAFSALVKPPAGAEDEDPNRPEPAGVFVSDGQTIRRIGGTGDATAVGVIDLATATDPEETGSDLPERTPAFTDDGGVAFLATVANGTAAAIFVRDSGAAELRVAIATGRSFDGEPIIALGPPALNTNGTLAFRAGTPSHLEDPDEIIRRHGIFRLTGSTLERLAGYGTVVNIELPIAHDQVLTDFGPTLAINDTGDVAFISDPVFDPRTTSSGEPGVFVHHDGAIHAVATPGVQIQGRGAISATALHEDLGSPAAAPRILADGTVVVLAEILSGPGTVIASAAPPTYELDELVGVTRRDVTPAGGTYRYATSTVAIDDDGAVSFTAEVAGTTVSEALIHVPASGDAEAIRVGDVAPAPTAGILGGAPFSSPLLNDAGDLVFKGFVTRGPGLGIFRARDGGLDALVRILDAAPVDAEDPQNPPRFIDLPGEPSLNAGGEVAFAGFVDGDLGIFAAGLGSVRRVAVPGDPIIDADRFNPTVRSVNPNPAILDDGSVVFGGRIRSTTTADPASPLKNEQGLLKADSAGIRILAVTGDKTDDASGFPLFRFRDASAGGNFFALRVESGSGDRQTGLVLGGPNGMSLALREGAVFGGAPLTELRGRPALNGAGDTATLALLGEDTVAILRTRAGVTEPVSTAGAPGPIGGVLRSLGRPAMASDGSVALRGTFEPGTGGTAGIFTEDGNGLVPHLVVGEQPSASVGGRITGLGQDVTINAVGEIAYRATVSGGRARQVIGIASASAMPKASAKLTNGLSSVDDPRDTVKFRALIVPGTTTNGYDPSNDPISLAILDSQITVWAASVPANELVQTGERAAKLPKNPDGVALRKLRVRQTRRGRIKVSGRSPLVDVTQSGLRAIVPPLTMRVDVGDDSAITRLGCKQRRNTFVCNAKFD